MADQITCEKVSASQDELMNLDSPVWDQVKTVTLDMTATPLANQPSPYIKATRNEEEIGKVKQLIAKTAHNGKELYFYFEWPNDTPNYEIGDLNVFPDGVSVLFAMNDGDECPIKEMGTPESPTNAWFWRADFHDKPKNQISRGLATTYYTEVSSIAGSYRWQDNRWQVVLGRAFTIEDTVNEEAVQLAAGAMKRIGFAAWEGASGERGGIKAFSKEWRELVISA